MVLFKTFECFKKSKTNFAKVLNAKKIHRLTKNSFAIKFKCLFKLY